MNAMTSSSKDLDMITYDFAIVYDAAGKDMHMNMNVAFANATNHSSF